MRFLSIPAVNQLDRVVLAPPNGNPATSEHLVCLTFDFDAMTGLVARGLKTPTPVSRGEFGAIAADRILALLARLSLIHI